MKSTALALRRRRGSGLQGATVTGSRLRDRARDTSRVGICVCLELGEHRGCWVDETDASVTQRDDGAIFERHARCANPNWAAVDLGPVLRPHVVDPEPVVAAFDGGVISREV